VFISDNLEMALRNLSKFLDPNFDMCPPTDVKFVFTNNEDSTKEVKAHKLILAFASEVFNREFYGSMESENVIEIRDSTPEVFKAMVEFIYHKKPHWETCDILVLNVSSCSFLSSMYYLAEKYNLETLKDEIIASIPKHLIFEKDLMEVAILA
jgi:hypothetical protein